jgi:hypothetical protein
MTGSPFLKWGPGSPTEPLECAAPTPHCHPPRFINWAARDTLCPCQAAGPGSPLPKCLAHCATAAQYQAVRVWDTCFHLLVRCVCGDESQTRPESYALIRLVPPKPIHLTCTLQLPQQGRRFQSTPTTLTRKTVSSKNDQVIS